jgi:hypothetical protein
MDITKIEIALKKKYYLQHETEIRPTVEKIMKILQRETIDDDDYINEFNENELQFDEKNDELTINNDYFTPPTKSFSQPFKFNCGSSSFSSFFSMFKLNK